MKKKFIPTTFTLALATLSLTLILPTACTRDELITPVPVSYTHLTLPTT